MNWQQLQDIKKYEKKLLYNSATGSSTDNTSDNGVSKDPNNYLVNKIGSVRSVLELILIVLLLVLALKQLKIF